MIDRSSVLWTGDGRLFVRIKVTPKSSADRIEGLTPSASGAALKVKVSAAPEDGAANDAVVGLIAEWAGIARNRVEIVSGLRSRVKTVAISGDPRTLFATLNDKLAGA